MCRSKLPCEKLLRKPVLNGWPWVTIAVVIAQPGEPQYAKPGVLQDPGKLGGGAQVQNPDGSSEFWC